MVVSVAVCEIFIVKEWYDLENILELEKMFKVTSAGL